MVNFKVEEGVELPKKESEEASGYDIIANSIITSFKGSVEANFSKIKTMQEGFKARGYIMVRPFERVLFGTGITVADMDKNLELQIRSRSGTTLKRGLVVANQPGTIDSDYRGQIGVIIYNSSPILAKVEKGERIAQMVPSLKTKVIIQEVSEISNSERGELGFGSTGN